MPVYIMSSTTAYMHFIDQLQMVPGSAVSPPRATEVPRLAKTGAGTWHSPSFPLCTSAWR